MRTPLRILITVAAVALTATALPPATPAAAQSHQDPTVFSVFHTHGFTNWEYRWTCDTQSPFACRTIDGVVVFSVQVANRPDPDAAVAVDFLIEDITAVHGVNYTGPTSGTLSIPAGRDRVQLAIPILDTGSVDAPNKTLRVRLTGSSVPGADLSDTGIGIIQSAGQIPRDCTPSRPDGESFSTTCSGRPAGSRWQVFVTCTRGFLGSSFFGALITGNGTSTVSCTGTGFPFLSWGFHLRSAGIQPSARIDGGDDHTVWLTPDGRAATTGDNSFGQLGDGTTTDRSVSGFVAGLTDVVAVSAGRFHNLALDSDGQVWAWGRNNGGQLGDGTTTDRLVPVPIDPGPNIIVAVSAGQFSSLALDSRGRVWAWGVNGSGQLGNGTTTTSLVPVQVDDTEMTDVVAIAAGLTHGLAIDATGTLWTWGDNFSGQLGDGTRTDRSVPVRVDGTGLGSVVAIAGGAGHSLAIDFTGAAWAWGNNFEGQLGDGTGVNSVVPVQVDDTELTEEVVAVAAGLGHSLAIDSDGDAWAWGRGGFGQLGNGSTTNSPAPVPVIMTDIDNSVSDIGAGIEHSLAIEDFPELGSWAGWAWGDGGNGQLGSGGGGDDFNEPVPMSPPVAS